VEADQPIILYCHLLTRFGTESWMPLAVESWGTDYVVSARPGEICNDVSPGGEFDYNKQSKMAPSEILIVSAYDDTHVTIQAKGRLLGTPNLTDVVLQAGQVYQVQSYVDTSVYADRQVDLGGSRVIATKPVGVISGNTRSQVLYFQEGLGQNIFKNMLLEWLTPTDQDGTEFVYLPTWDEQRPTGAPGEDLSAKRKGEYVRIYATTDGVMTGYSLDNNIGRTDFSITGAGSFREEFIGTPEARYYRTDKPAEAMMNATAIVKYNGTTQGFGGYIGAQFDGWAAYMVELIPRHRWVDYAPYYASAEPAGMKHYINVVTDTAHQNDIYMENGSRFLFNRGRINGTDLIWGTMVVTTSQDHWLEGRNGALFSGHVYGLYKGHEEYRPGGARKSDDGDSQSAGASGEDDGQPLHPSEYEEFMAVSYGYPLISEHLMDGPADQLRLESSTDCSVTTTRISVVNAKASGLRSIHLDSAVNARIVSTVPDAITAETAATITVAPLRPDQDAHGVIVVDDRTGHVTRIPYSYFAERLDSDPVSGSRDFGFVRAGMSATRTVTFTNPLSRAITLNGLSLRDGGRGFMILSTDPASLPSALPAGGSFTVTVQAVPALDRHIYIDSLLVTLGCTTVGIELKVESVGPRIEVSDVGFGIIDPAMAGTREMKVCNIGTGELGFTQGPGGDFLEWLRTSEFTVAAAELEKLRMAKIGADGCITIAVGFHATTEGNYRDSAQLFANVDNPKDWSIWTAEVRTISVVPGSTDAARSLTVQPNPVTGTTTFRLRMEHAGTVRLLIVDADGREVGAVDRMLPAGEQSLLWDASGLPAGVYFYRLIDGVSVASGSVVVVR
jgi:hypothetical protein